MFKPGQKVVYVGGEVSSHDAIDPKIGTVMTINKKSPYYPNAWWIVEYPVTTSGRTQSFPTFSLRPLAEVLQEISIESLKSEIYENNCQSN